MCKNGVFTRCLTHGMHKHVGLHSFWHIGVLEMLFLQGFWYMAAQKTQFVRWLCMSQLLSERSDFISSGRTDGHESTNSFIENKTKSNGVFGSPTSWDGRRPQHHQLARSHLMRALWLTCGGEARLSRVPSVSDSSE